MQFSPGRQSEKPPQPPVLTPFQSLTRYRRISLLRTAVTDLFAVLFPTVCPVCGEELRALSWVSLCATCRNALKPWEGARCAQCGLPFASERASDSDLCGMCRTGLREFDLARSYGIYSFPLREAILELKFRRRERWGLYLGSLLAWFWTAGALLPEKDCLLVPVPLHPARERERGFNQAALLARGLRRKLAQSGGCVPRLETGCLLRVQHTRSQSGLTRRARMENVRAAFRVVRPERVRGRVIVLIDDVMTTGATATACARVLKQAGAAFVLVLSLARASPQFPNAGISSVDGAAGD